MAEYLEDKKDAALDDVVQQLQKICHLKKLAIFDKMERGKEAKPHIIEKLKKIDNIQDYFEYFEMFGD
jgi:exonuclease VII large subunit